VSAAVSARFPSLTVGTSRPRKSPWVRERE
jgi:hypothetical protein